MPDIVTSLESEFTYYDRRHLLKPGITGWATVRCGYSGTPIGEAWKLCHDLYYLKRRSLFFDLLIMIETATRDLRPRADQPPGRALHRRVPLRYALADAVGDRLSPPKRGQPGAAVHASAYSCYTNYCVGAAGGRTGQQDFNGRRQ